MNTAQAQAIGVFGGTFDPVHYGHLRSALELCEQLGLAELRLMPCATPPHRDLPARAAHHRAAMVELAVEGESRLVCDARELRRSGPSYTIDSLIELRGELGSHVSINLVMGCDAVLGVDNWHRWQELLDWANVVVIARPGWQLPGSGAVASWIGAHRVVEPAGLSQHRAGAIYIGQLRPLAISSTEIRTMLGAGLSARYLMPEAVLHYIEQHGLYRHEQV